MASLPWTASRIWRWLRPLLLLLLGILVLALDRQLLEMLAWPHRPPKSDLLLLLRVWGSMWTWLLLTIFIAVLELRGNRRPPAQIHSRLGVLMLSPLLGGLAAELLKLLLRRERPSDLDVYVFRAWAERPLSTGGLGLPSSHAAVAFAGSAALALLFPELRWPALVMALGCGFTRIATGAHYPSDVLLAALVGIGCAWWVDRRLVPWIRRHGFRLPLPPAGPSRRAAEH